MTVSVKGVERSLAQIPTKELNKLLRLLSCSVSLIAEQEQIEFCSNKRRKQLSEMTANEVWLLRESLSAYLSGVIVMKELSFCLSDDECQLVKTMYSCNLNTMKCAQVLGLSRQNVRTRLKSFQKKWKLDLTSISDVVSAMTFVAA